MNNQVVELIGIGIGILAAALGGLNLFILSGLTERLSRLENYFMSQGVVIHNRRSGDK